jgi:hypothetical protein
MEFKKRHMALTLLGTLVAYRGVIIGVRGVYINQN